MSLRRSGNRTLPAGPWIGRLWNARQERVEGAPAARFAFNPDITAALLHNAVNGSETEASAFPRLLGCEKGFEDARTRFRVHSMSRISNHDRDVFSFREEWLWLAAPRETETSLVSMLRRPPCGIASRAFPARFKTICCNCPRSTFTHQGSDRAAGRGRCPHRARAAGCHPYLPKPR